MALFLRLEAGAGGTPREALDQACDVATRIGIWVQVEINGVDVLVPPSGNKDALYDSWSKAIDRGVSFCSENVTPKRT